MGACVDFGLIPSPIVLGGFMVWEGGLRVIN